MTSQLSHNDSLANQAELIKGLIREGIAAAQNRKQRLACKLFWNAIEIDPRHVQAWLWLSSTVERPIDQIACLEIVLQLDPGNLQAHDQLARLTGVRRFIPAVSPEMADRVVEPPSQADSQAISESTATAGTVEKVVEPPDEPDFHVVSATPVEAQPEVVEEIIPLPEHHSEQVFEEEESGQAREVGMAQAPDLVNWVVRPPVGEQVLVIAGSEEKVGDPHALRRKRDYELVTARFAQSPYVRVVSTEGTPPERYSLEYRVKGLTEEGGRISERDTHIVEISLLLDYPRLRPICRMLTPVFHPNIDVDGTICIGDHWAAGEMLTSILVQIAQILTYQSYNIRSPRNAQAARWASENANDLPLQRTDFWE